MNELDKAAKTYSEEAKGLAEHFLRTTHTIEDVINIAFRAGAEWQAEQAKVLEDALEKVAAYFDCMHCENHTGYTCEDHLEDRMKAAKSALNKYHER